jgi:hypothetical protein
VAQGAEDCDLRIVGYDVDLESRVAQEDLEVVLVDQDRQRLV